jgi:hypothetical protein
MYANYPEDYAIDVASMIFKDRVPIDRNIQHENYSEIAGELMLAHFTHFLGKDEVEEFKSFVEESDSNFLKSVFDFYEKNFEQEIKQILGDIQMTDEEKSIIDEMNKSLENED